MCQSPRGTLALRGSRPSFWWRPSFWLWLTWCRADRKECHGAGMAGSLPAHGRRPLNRPEKPRLDSGRPSRQNEREADRPAGALYAVTYLYLMFGRKKTEPVKPKPKLDKSGIWYDPIMFHCDDTSNRGEARILTEYQKRHPDATPAFATNVIFGNYIYWFRRNGSGESYIDEERKGVFNDLL